MNFRYGVQNIYSLNFRGSIVAPVRTTLVRNDMETQTVTVTLPHGYIRVWHGPVRLSDFIISYRELFVENRVELVPVTPRHVTNKDDAREFACVIRKGSDDVGKVCAKCKAFLCDNDDEPDIILCRHCIGDVYSDNPFEDEDDEYYPFNNLDDDDSEDEDDGYSDD